EDERAALRAGLRHARPQPARLLDRLRDGRVDVRRDLEHRLQQLRLDLDVAEARDELATRRVDQLELLLDADRERLPSPEVDRHRAPSCSRAAGRKRQKTKAYGRRFSRAIRRPRIVTEKTRPV